MRFFRYVKHNIYINILYLILYHASQLKLKLNLKPQFLALSTLPTLSCSIVPPLIISLYALPSHSSSAILYYHYYLVSTKIIAATITSIFTIITQCKLHYYCDLDYYLVLLSLTHILPLSSPPLLFQYCIQLIYCFNQVTCTLYTVQCTVYTFYNFTINH